MNARVVLLFTLLFLNSAEVAAETNVPTPIRIGWISAMSGPVAKYGAHLAAKLAVEEINSKGGITGRPLELIMEDGRCEGAATAKAANKLIHLDRVDFILGGHCSTETLTLAPIAEQKKVVVLASISTSPDITDSGDYIFRTSPVSTVQSELVSDYLINKTKVRKLAIIAADTNYAEPIATRLAASFQELGGELTYYDTYHPNETDFRAMIVKVKSSKPDAIFISVQTQDSAHLLAKQLRDLDVKAVLLGNEIAGNAVAVFPNDADLFEGMIFGESHFDTSDNVKTEDFIQRFKEEYKVDRLPLGFWTAESYDGVMLLAETIEKCGFNKEAVRDCLYKVKNYQGASGRISIDENGDGIRTYVLKHIVGGTVTMLGKE